uniref:SPRY-associated domain-containing protein n=1 Tax=Sinocyclocheilus anshuiensis TaxID=1608454 RepID=A0A671Q2D5_9TELE
ERKRKFQQRIQQRQKDLEELREAVESHERSAQTAVEDSEGIFTELIRSIERSRSEVTQRIRERERAAVSRAEGPVYRLEQEIDDLKRRHAELEQISHIHGHTKFLKSFQSLAVSPESGDEPNITLSSLLSFDDVGKSLYQLKEKLEDFWLGVEEHIFIVLGPHTLIKNDILIYTIYSSRFTLDPNTVNKHLCLSERNRVVTFTAGVQQYPDHPDRFHYYPQVLCRESVCGRCYWELEWSGSGFVESVTAVPWLLLIFQISYQELWSLCNMSFHILIWWVLCLGAFISAPVKRK